MSKYHSIKATVDGITFDSRKEAERYIVLKSLEKQGVIHNLRRQVPYELTKPYKLAGRLVRASRYFADFVYEKGAETIVEDVKGYRTAEYKLKRNIMHEKYGIIIQEV